VAHVGVERHYRVSVPFDAVAPIDTDLGDAALRMMQRNMRAAVVGAAELIERSSTA